MSWLIRPRSSRPSRSSKAPKWDACLAKQATERPHGLRSFGASATSSRSSRFASARPPLRREPTGQLPLLAGGFLPAENFAPFAIENEQGDGVGRPCGDRSGDDCSGDIGGADLVFAQDRRRGIGSCAHELDAEWLRGGNAGRLRLVFRVRLRLRLGTGSSPLCHAWVTI